MQITLTPTDNVNRPNFGHLPSVMRTTISRRHIICPICTDVYPASTALHRRRIARNYVTYADVPPSRNATRYRRRRITRNTHFIGFNSGRPRNPSYNDTSSACKWDNVWLYGRRANSRDVESRGRERWSGERQRSSRDRSERGSEGVVEVGWGGCWKSCSRNETVATLSRVFCAL